MVSRAGFVLTGGKSSRMGRDKALLSFHGRTLVEHVAEAVRMAAGSVALVGPLDRYAHLGYPVVADNFRDRGPLAGIQTVLSHTTADWNLVVACDMPRVSAPFLSSLVEAAEQSDADCLIPIGPSREIEPLCAVYHLRCLQPITDLLARNVLKMSEAVAALKVRQRPVAESGWFENINTPEQWEHYADRP